MRKRLSKFLARFVAAEQGAVLVLAAAGMVVVMGAAAMTVDVGLLVHERANVQKATDAGALAGAQLLPDNPGGAQAMAMQYTLKNDPTLTADEVQVTFRCIISASGGSPNLSDVPSACDPGGDASWTVRGSTAVSPCVPASGDKCNSIVVRARNEVDFHLAPALGIDSGSTGTLTSAACRGACGSPSGAPVDLVMILDRTSSMSSGDVASTRNAANAVLKAYDPSFQWVGLGLLGSSNGGGCRGTAATRAGTNWLPVGLSGNGAPVNESYVSGGALNGGSSLVQTIGCYNQSRTGTDLASPVSAAASYLRSNGRAEAAKGILLMSDGEPNGSTCAAAASAAAAAKASDIEVYTVGFGVSSANRCPDTSGAWRGKSVVQLLATMATDSVSLGCSSADNSNDDHFFCMPANSALAGVFKTAAQDLASGSTRLIIVE